MDRDPNRAAVAGVVLAGGSSRRMGTPKANLPFGSGTLLDWAGALVLGAVAEVWVSAAAPRGEAPSWSRGWLPDGEPGSGPLGALHTALVTLRRPVLLVACDLPFLDPRDLRDLAQSAPGAARLLGDASGAQPLAGVYSPSLAPAIGRRLAAGDRSMNGLLAESPPELLAARTRAEGCPPLANLNTLEDYRAALAAARRAGWIGP